MMDEQELTRAEGGGGCGLVPSEGSVNGRFLPLPVLCEDKLCPPQGG